MLGLTVLDVIVLELRDCGQRISLLQRRVAVGSMTDLLRLGLQGSVEHSQEVTEKKVSR